jgi:malonate transporter
VTGVLDGFATIGILIALGILIAQLGLVDAAGQRTLTTLSFYVASPALLVTVLQDTDVGAIFSAGLVAMVLPGVVSAVIFGAVAVLRREELGASVIGTLCASYGNTGNLGLPIAAYALGDPASVAPLLLAQLLFLQPVALTLLDVATSPTRLSVGRILARPVTNPITVGSLLGVALSLTGIRLPHAIGDPLDLVASMAVPCMLLAYGVSLRLGPLPGRGVPPGELGLVVGLKMVVQPLAGYVMGRLLGLDDHMLLTVTVLAALPTAQNVYVIATRYERAAVLARDSIFISTILSVPVILVAAVLLA